jgi:uncharacterized coiled-coil protein SlyX
VTPLERLLCDMQTEARIRAYEAQMAFEKKAKADLKALAEYHRRCLGQLFRYAARRLRASQGGVQ